MKWLFLILVLANLALAAWEQFARQSAPNPLARQELNADKIRFAQPLPQSLPVSAPLPAKANPVESICYKWGIFSGNSVEKARNALKTLAQSGTVSEQSLPKSDKLGYWAYIPPKKTKQEALDEIRMLNELGIKDHFLIQDSGKWQYAVSLGVFRTDEAAGKYVSILRGRGLKSALSGRRDSGDILFLVSGVQASFAAEVKKLDFPKAKLETADCNAIAEKASRD
ncbi:MAG: hypothetical protein K2P57_02280 [Burkholderiales bacterium]|nr:hypothetical protein [Burkholderiales bacterium]